MSCFSEGREIKQAVRRVDLLDSIKFVYPLSFPLF